MKLHPHLDDYWTQHGITELSYKEDSCWGIGLSIKVGLHALAEREDLVLYSYKPDALKEEGDLFVLVFEKAIAERLELERQPYASGHSPLEYWCGGPIALEEFVWTADLQRRFRFPEKRPFDQQLMAQVYQTIYSHDNFILQLHPISPSGLKGVLSPIRHLHNYYLDHLMDGTVLDAFLLDQLLNKGTFKIKSNPLAGTIVLITKERAPRGLKRLLGFKIDKETLIYQK